ncbi:MAG: hypothetical protein ACI8TS_001734, partial [Flavobacteriales bacterium]
YDRRFNVLCHHCGKRKPIAQKDKVGAMLAIK